jgi:hypothetical protein
VVPGECRYGQIRKGWRLVSGWARKTIAACEILGGAFGLIWLGSELMRRPTQGPGLLLAGVVAALFLLSLCAGLLLWQNLRAGYAASIVVQLTQLGKVLSPQFAFMMSYGFDVAPMIVAARGPPPRTGIRCDVRLTAHYLLRVDDPSIPEGMGLSIISCVALRFLLRGSNPGRNTTAPGTEPDNAGIENDNSQDPISQLRRRMDAVTRARQRPG